MMLAEGLAHDVFDEAAPPLRLPVISDAAVRELVAEIERTGFAMLPNYLPPEMLGKLQSYVSQAVSRAGGEYTVLNGKAVVADTLLAELPETPEFASLLRRLYEQGTGKAAPDQAIYQVLRCLAGQTALKECFIFHYDSYVVTLLLPILIPSQGKRGHLVMAPNLRGVRPSYLLNILDKLVIDNRLTQFLLKRLFLSGLLKLRRVEMVPGNLYMFWGYRSLHTNEPCDPENIRSTALYHFGDPHSASRLRRNMGRVAV
jgi:hypothetical protein